MWILAAEAATEETLEAVRLTLVAIQAQLVDVKDGQASASELGQVLIGVVIGGFGALVTIVGLKKLWTP